jgi:hypothetical protein
MISNQDDDNISDEDASFELAIEKPTPIEPTPPINVNRKTNLDQELIGLNPRSPWNELTSKLHNFQSAHRVSKKAMSHLLKLLDEARQYPEETLNVDWRTVLRHKAKQEIEVLRRTIGGNEAASNAFCDDVFVCSACAGTSFTLDEIKAASECSACKVPWVQCSFKFCRAVCVCVSRLEKGSLNTIIHCLACNISSQSAYTARNYVLDLKKSIQSLFRNANAALNALAPWTDDARKFFSGGTPGKPVVPNTEWLEQWKDHVRSLPYKSESWHGDRFLNHPIWHEHGMRSLLLVVYLDWFPPFDITNPYSIGLLSVSILNFSCHERGRTGAIWPVMILSGPSQVPRMYSVMKDVLSAVNDMYINGVAVYDDLTKTNLRVHVAVAQVVADRPAGAKIGEYKGHSSYFSCHRCYYKGAICAHAILSDDTSDEPIVYDNVNFDPETMSEDDRVLLTGEARKKRRGEHIVWLEADLIPREKLVHEDDLRTSQIKIHKRITNPPKSWTKTDLNNWLSDQRHNGMSPLVLLNHFGLVDDVVLDGMHLFFKGVCHQLARLTLGPKEYNKERWNMHSDSKNIHNFEDRLARFDVPEKFDRHNDIALKVNGIHAAALFNFLKVQALLALESLVPGDVWEVWRLMVEVTCGIHHTHVPKQWVTNPEGLAASLKKLILSFQKIYGVCSMTPNWHLLLHLATDYESWSALRTHWAFGSERLNHEIIADIRAISQAHVDASVASASTKYASMTALERSLTTKHSTTNFLKHTFNPSQVHSPEIEFFLDRGYQTLKTGLIRAQGGKILKCSMRDIVWLCDPRSPLIPANSQSNLFLVVVIAGLPSKEDFVFGLSQLVGVSKRMGYSNTFEWIPNDTEQARQVVTVVESDCKLICESVAVYNEHGFKKVLVPTCGNLPY